MIRLRGRIGCAVGYTEDVVYEGGCEWMIEYKIDIKSVRCRCLWGIIWMVGLCVYTVADVLAHNLICLVLMIHICLLLSSKARAAANSFEAITHSLPTIASTILSDSFNNKDKSDDASYPTKHRTKNNHHQPMLFIDILLALSNRRILIGIDHTIVTAFSSAIVPAIVVEYLCTSAYCIVAVLHPINTLHPVALYKIELGAVGIGVVVVEYTTIA